MPAPERLPILRPVSPPAPFLSLPPSPRDRDRLLCKGVEPPEVNAVTVLAVSAGAGATAAVDISVSGECVAW
jgi:hypothetical protein